MRKIYYVPEGQDINDYKDIWENHTTEIHTSVSENTKEYIKKKPSIAEGFLKFPATTYSPTLVARVVPLALQGLTAEFEMGSGVTPVL